ncbi:O-antigen ligase family protein [Archangium violaceum]|uniref:O-antigen ligase family protein n=1 Tax=Archangium violaceum TaxID=83451 RepID=UPI00193B008F|nr:O-antigen ligase family protein [Archangium violaceum]QRK07741.1 O-antigen ligase family protein [Archangium violaceum]
MTVRAGVLERGLLVCLALWGVGCLFLEGLAAVGFAGCALGALGAAWRRGVTVRGALRAWAPLVAFLAWALLVPTLSGHPPSGTGVARLLDFVGIPVAAVALGQLSDARRVRLAWVLGGVFLVSCAVAGLQHFGVWPGPEAWAPFAWTRLPFDRVYELVPGTENRFMAGGLLFHRLKFSHIGGMIVAFALGMGLLLEGRRRTAALCVAAVGLVSVGLFPYARAASVALVGVMGLVVLLGLPRRVALPACAAVLGLAVLTLTLNRPLRERFLNSTTQQGSGSRAALLETGLCALRQSPVTGVGPGRFQARLYATPDMPEQAREHPGKSHNQFLSMAAETGVPGALLFVVLLGWLARRLPRTRPEGLGALGALVFFCLLSLLHDPLFHTQASQAFVLILGAGFAGPPVPENKRSAS